MPRIKKCFLLIIIITGFFQVLYLRFDYPFISIDWALHNDEKVMIPDAKCYFLNNTKQISIFDYRPYPTSAMFGIAGPAIIDLGFRIFGMNNVGLRFFFVIVTVVTTVLCVFLILKVAPGLSGFFFSAIYVFSYANFILNRYAVLENFLTFFLIGILWLYIAKREVFLDNLFKICFLAGISVLFKGSFVFYIYLLLFIIIVIEIKVFKKILKVILWSFFAVFIFEVLQFFILSRMGIAHIRYQSLLTVLFYARGLTTGWGSLRPLAYPHPINMEIFSIFPISLSGWYGIPKAIFYRVYHLDVITGCLVTLVLIISIFWGIRRIIPKEGLVIALFIMGYLLFSSFFLYYTKRGVSLFPFVFIFLALLLHEALLYFSKNLFKIYRITKTVLILTAIIYSAFQAVIFIQMSAGKSDQVEKNSLALDNDLPKGSVIYAHSFGYRFFWLSKEQRLLSGDDAFFNNAMILAWALKDHGRYLLLSDRAGSLSVIRGPKISEVLQQVKTLKILKLYYTTETESDCADWYTLMEIIYN